MVLLIMVLHIMVLVIMVLLIMVFNVSNLPIPGSMHKPVSKVLARQCQLRKVTHFTDGRGPDSLAPERGIPRWKVKQLDNFGRFYGCSPILLEPVDFLENPPGNPIPMTSQVSSDSLSERSQRSPGLIDLSNRNPSSPALIKTLVNSVLRRKRTVIASEAPPPDVDDRKHYAAGN